MVARNQPNQQPLLRLVAVEALLGDSVVVVEEVDSEVGSKTTEEALVAEVSAVEADPASEAASTTVVVIDLVIGEGLRMVRRADLAVRLVVVVVGSGVIAVDTLADLAVTAAIAEDLVVVVVAGLVGLATGTGIAEVEDSVDVVPELAIRAGAGSRLVPKTGPPTLHLDMVTARP